MADERISTQEQTDQEQISQEEMNLGSISKQQQTIVCGRFRGYYPVVVDVETGGFNAKTDALLEIAAATFSVDEQGAWFMDECLSRHIEPFEGSTLEPAAMEFTGINPEHPFRKQIAVSEKEALQDIFKMARKKMKAYGCKRAILVGHNPSFDLGFVQAAAARSDIKKSPFHPFSTFDTVTLGGLVYGQTVLSKVVIAAGISWDEKQAHSARYDTEKTAKLFCNIVNQWRISDDKASNRA